LIAHTVQSVIS